MFTSEDLLYGVRMTQLNDPDATTWSDATLIIALNQALRMLSLVRPDATSKIAILTLVAGSRQYIPTSDGVRLLRVVRNIRADNTVGNAVRLVSQEGMDSMSPDWHNAVGATVKEYMFDIRSPKHFYIYPAVPAGSKVEVEYSSYLNDITEATVANDFPVSPVFSQPLQELMLYKLLSGDSTSGDNGEAHLQVAMELLGVKDAADEQSSSARRTST